MAVWGFGILDLRVSVVSAGTPDPGAKDSVDWIRLVSLCVIECGFE